MTKTLIPLIGAMSLAACEPSNNISFNDEYVSPYGNVTVTVEDDDADLDPGPIDPIGYIDPAEIECLASNVYFEARGSTFMDQVAVAHVTLNRTRERWWPDTICEVVHEPYQFSWTLNDQLNVTDTRSWERAVMIAEQVIVGDLPDPTGVATHYHTTEVSPFWSKSGVNKQVIGAHVYMRMASGRR